MDHYEAITLGAAIFSFAMILLVAYVLLISFKKIQLSHKKRFLVNMTISILTLITVILMAYAESRTCVEYTVLKYCEKIEELEQQKASVVGHEKYVLYKTNEINNDLVNINKKVDELIENFSKENSEKWKYQLARHLQSERE